MGGSGGDGGGSGRDLGCRVGVTMGVASHGVEGWGVIFDRGPAKVPDFT
jgi:hypothetical protein